jgi:hypothetical protein
MGGAQQRSRTEPENQERHQQHGRCEKEAKAGKHGRSEILRKLWRTGTWWPLELELARDLPDSRLLTKNARRKSKASAGIRLLVKQIGRALERRIRLVQE